MKLFIYFVSGLLMVLGVISFFPPPGDANDVGVSASEMVFGGVLIVWGSALAWSYRANYRGGLATTVGAFLLGSGVYVSLVPFFMDASQPQASAGVKLAAALLLLVPAVALLTLGHRIHTRRSIAARKQGASLDAGTHAVEPAASLESKDVPRCHEVPREHFWMLWLKSPSRRDRAEKISTIPLDSFLKAGWLPILNSRAGSSNKQRISSDMGYQLG